MKILRLLQMIATTLAIVAVPTAAWAVSVSSNDGSGSQYITDSGDQSFRSDGTLKSTLGNRIYYRGIVIYNFYPDYTCNRISRIIDDRTSQNVGGACGQLSPIPPSADAAGWKICRYRRLLPDGCGSMARENF
ncbi:MAG: hypothetical protein ACRCYU_03825 [Nocardioides sp.]